MYKEGKFIDEEFARWCSDHNTTWNDSNFFISDDVGVLSNCCFDGKQMCLSKSSSGVNYMSFKELYESSTKDTKRNFTIFHNGSWVKGKIIKLPKRDMYKITTTNKKELYVTDNHIFPTLNGDKEVSKITTKDYLMFNSRKLDTFPEKDKGLTYEQGVLIGMYLGDGSCYLNKEGNNTPTINLSLNDEKYNSTLNIIESAITRIDKSAKYTLNKPYNHVYPTTIRNWAIYNFINEYVGGDYCYEKELNMDCLLQSYDFRKGVLDGYCATDGGNSNRIYTTSKKLVGQIECLITSLGMNSVVDCTDRTDEAVIIRGKSFNRNYPLYCIRWYSPMNKRTRKDEFVVKNNCEYFKVDTIEQYEANDDSVYCFEMDNFEEPYFTLPNGVITHNCRLLSDTSKLDAFINSIGGTALSIGSVKVNTTNLMRIFYETGADEDKYLELLRHRIELCCKVLDCVRHIIKRNIDKGLLPNYQDGGIELAKQYCTVGILGLFEVIEAFGYTEKDEFGYISYKQEGIDFAGRIFETINDVKDNFTDEYSFNVESVPAERCAIVLCAKDDMLYKPKNDKFIYSNQWIPLMEKCTIKEKLRLSSILDRKCSGGSIAHINLERNFPNTDVAWDMLNKIAQENVIYFAFNTKINECKNHHGFVGSDICPICGEGVYDTYQRIVGYLVPSRAYSKDRKKEFSAREWYSMAEMRGE